MPRDWTEIRRGFTDANGQAVTLTFSEYPPSSRNRGRSSERGLQVRENTNAETMVYASREIEMNHYHNNVNDFYTALCDAICDYYTNNHQLPDSVTLNGVTF